MTISEIIPAAFITIMGLLYLILPDAMRKIRWNISEVFGYKAIKDNAFNSIGFYRTIGIFFLLGAIYLLVISLNN